MRPSTRILVLVSLLALGWTSQLRGATYIVPEDHQLIASAELITTGVVIGSHTRKSEPDRIETVYQVQVAEVLKGSAPSTLDVVARGGRFGDETLHVSGAPNFLEGQPALLFLRRISEGEWAVVGLELGLFNRATDRHGRSLLIRGDGAGESFGWGTDGQRWVERPRLEGEFIRYVRDIARGVPGRANYFTSWESAGGIRLEATGVQTNAGASTYSDPRSRITMFANNQSVVFRTNGLQEGFGPESVNAAVRAAATWNAVADTNIRLVVSGTTTATMNLSDSVWALAFNDPAGLITDSHVLAITDRLTSTTHSFAGESFQTIRNADVVIRAGFPLQYGIMGLQTVITHELGHALGFKHSPDRAVMNAVFTEDFGGILQPWDLAAALALYHIPPPDPAPEIVSFTATPATVNPGQPTTLSWSTSNATSVTLSLDGSDASVPVNGSLQVTPARTCTATLTASGPGGTVTSSVTITVPEPPAIFRFDATPEFLMQGETARLTWTTSNATSVTIDNGIGVQPVNGSIAVMPLVPTLYTLTATGAHGVTTRTLFLYVVQAPSIGTFAATPAEIIEGETSILSWSTAFATSVTIDNGLGPQPINTENFEEQVPGSVAVSPTVTTTYTLLAEGPAGTSAATTTITVKPATPAITSFGASPAAIPIHGSSVLSWTTTNATSVTIEPGLGMQPANGSIPVNPGATTTYTLTAIGPAGNATATVTVTISPVPTIVAFHSSPKTISNGEASTLSWSTTDATSVTIEPGLGVHQGSGSISVFPVRRTVYTLTATGPGGTSSTTVAVNVNQGKSRSGN